MANSYLTPKKKQTDDLDAVFDYQQTKKQKAKYAKNKSKSKKKKS